MGQPPSVQRYLGMIWMSQLLYPDVAQYDAFEEVSRYYSLFYHIRHYTGAIQSPDGKFTLVNSKVKSDFQFFQPLG